MRLASYLVSLIFLGVVSHAIPLPKDAATGAQKAGNLGDADDAVLYAWVVDQDDEEQDTKELNDKGVIWYDDGH
ncbi:MAG: hypothetical protein M1822_004435 [Bathelium mastoideum]|nr:MAG: hypothetical protein M1822_004435 [Bathelium mastoideum]